MDADSNHLPPQEDEGKPAKIRKIEENNPAQQSQTEQNGAEGEETLSFEDILKAQEQEAQEELELMDEAVALGLTEATSKICTYPEGSKKRQALYSCITCRSADPTVPAGICYGCCMNCHADHEVVELYTKRNFCCDCGNSKFKTKCTLYEDKLPLNKRNTYNHNFFGTYCACDKPFPPEENDPNAELEMVQCIICEDWYHMKHICDGEDVQSKPDGEMACRECVQKLPFLSFYIQNLEKLLAGEGTSSSTCILEGWQKTEELKTVEFPSADWRNCLCKCSKCTEMYQDLNCEYLLDEEDTMASYTESSKEAADKEEPQNSGDYDKQMVDHIVQSAGRDQAIDVLQGFNHLKSELGKYLASLEKGTVVTSGDISKFFDGLKKSGPSGEDL